LLARPRACFEVLLARPRARFDALALGCAALLLACGARDPHPAARRSASASSGAHENAPAQPAGSSRAPSAREAGVIRELMRETEALRGLRFRAPVEARIQDRAAMRDYVKGALDDQDLARARRRYLALGLLDPELDVRELIESLMEEELIGYYDPERKLLAVRDDVARSLTRSDQAHQDLEWRATVVHELVHALQDQHLGLSQAMERERTTDEENAFGALVEGDATLAMLGYAAARQGGSLQALVADTAGLAAGLRAAPAHAGGRLGQAPAIVREPLLFRYREGAVFAARLFAASGWAGVDAAHRRQPATTLAVSQPGLYLRQEEPPPLSPPELAFVSEQRCQVVDQDVLGSLELGVALTQDEFQARELGRSWRGDRYAVLECAAGDASIWFLRLSEPQAARKWRAAFARLDAGQAVTRFVAIHGTRLVVARNLDAKLLPELEARFRSWASAP
jgi:hypothetical protein